MKRISLYQDGLLLCYFDVSNVSCFVSFTDSDALTKISISDIVED